MRILPAPDSNAASKVRSSHFKCPSCCPAFLAFFFFGIVFVPIAVFAICAFFALPLWALECAEVTAEYGPSPEDIEASAPGFCSWYEWWKYIVGNLVGVGGLTSVGPESGHVAAEVIDLLISVWSLTIAGLVIGIVGNMAWVGLLTEGADSKISSASERVMTRMKLLAASEEGISLNRFKELCIDGGIPLNDERLQELFNEADSDQNGTIDSNEIEQLLAKVRAETSNLVVPVGEAGTEALSRRLDALEQRMDAKLDRIEKLLNKLTS